MVDACISWHQKPTIHHVSETASVLVITNLLVALTWSECLFCLSRCAPPPRKCSSIKFHAGGGGLHPFPFSSHKRRVLTYHKYTRFSQRSLSHSLPEFCNPFQHLDLVATFLSPYNIFRSALKIPKYQFTPPFRILRAYKGPPFPPGIVY